jgi:hypothetical protein
MLVFASTLGLHFLKLKMNRLYDIFKSPSGPSTEKALLNHTILSPSQTSEIVPLSRIEYQQLEDAKQNRIVVRGRKIPANCCGSTVGAVQKCAIAEKWSKLWRFFSYSLECCFFGFILCVLTKEEHI